MVLNDWIRGKIPFFVRPPDADAPLPEVAGAPTQIGGTVVAGGKVTKVGEGSGGMIGEKPRGKGKGVIGVEQRVGAIIVRTAFEGEDADVRVPKSAAGEEMEVEEEVDEADGDVELAAEDAEEEQLGWDEAFATVGGEKTVTTEEDDSDDEERMNDSDDADDDDESVQSTVASSRKGKGKAVVSVSDDDDQKPQKKEARMTTNKRKAENFFSHANVKNKNRNRTIPRPGSGGGAAERQRASATGALLGGGRAGKTTRGGRKK